MRVCFVHDTIGDLGGAEASVRHSANGLAERGHDVALLHGHDTGTGRERFEAIFADRFDWTASADRAVARALAWQPDVIFVHKLARIDVLAELVASGVPLVRMMHDHDMYCQRSSRYFPWSRKPCTRRAGIGCLTTCAVVRNRDGRLPVKLAWPGLKLRELELCRQFDRTLVVTNFMRGELLKHGFDGDRINILPPVPKPAPAKFAPTYATPTVLYVGQLIRGKGVDFLIRSLPHLTTTGWQAKIIGEGSMRAELEQLTERLGIADRVTFTGWVAQDELSAAYRDARVGIVPSVWPEPIATIGLEFMQHSMPVVGFDSGGISDWLIDGENGYLVPARDEAGLTRAIDAVIGDADRAAEMGRDGLAKARSWHNQVEAFDRLTEMLAETAATRRAQSA